MTLEPRPRVLYFTFFVLGGCLASIGCSDTSPTGATSTNGSGVMRVVEADPSFATVIQEIFDRRGCQQSGCHGLAQSAGLDLRAGASYGSLVGIPATSESFLRVAPGSPDESYLVIKVEGRQRVGSRMPQAGASLDSTDLANLRNWIAQGARDN